MKKKPEVRESKATRRVHELYAPLSQSAMRELASEQYLSARSAHNLVFHGSELVEAFATFNRTRTELFESLGLGEDAVTTHTGKLIADAMHISYHLACLRPSLNRLMCGRKKPRRRAVGARNPRSNRRSSIDGRRPQSG